MFSVRPSIFLRVRTGIGFLMQVFSVRLAGRDNIWLVAIFTACIGFLSAHSSVSSSMDRTDLVDLWRFTCESIAQYMEPSTPYSFEAKWTSSGWKIWVRTDNELEIATISENRQFGALSSPRLNLNPNLSWQKRKHKARLTVPVFLTFFEQVAKRNGPNIFAWNMFYVWRPHDWFNVKKEYEYQMFCLLQVGDPMVLIDVKGNLVALIPGF